MFAPRWAEGSSVKPPSLVFGIPIDDLTMDATLDAIDDLVADGRQHGRTHQIATVNVDFLVNALSHIDLHVLLQQTALNLADGLPLVWIGRLFRLPLTERVAGADLVPLLAAESSRRSWRIHFFGSAPGVAERALDMMREQYPGASVTSTSSPMITDVRDVDPSVLDEIVAHEPDILCVALGNPKQERFIAEHAARLGVPVMIGIGGSLDMFVGDKKRAPRWAQRSGVEWVFRAAQEPLRLGRRYAKDGAVFAPHVVSYFRRLQQHRAGSSLHRMRTNDDVVAVAVAGSEHVAPFDFSRAFEDLRRGSNLSVDLHGGVPHPTALTELIGLLRAARQFSGTATVTNVDPDTHHALVDDLALPEWMVRGFGSTEEFR